MTALDAHVVRHVADFALDAQVRVDAGEVVAVLGPNGAGKSTLLRAIAGLDALDAGHIKIGDRCIDDPGGGTFLDPSERDVGVVFQDLLLFPRKRVLANVAFGLRARGASRAEAAATARLWLQRMGIAELADRRPRQLSGGQAQRVALARALAVEPAVLLLDEPLSALDASTRGHVRAELRSHLADFAGATVLVTHDPIDALVLADRLVILEDGTVVQQGTPDEVTARPATSYVADLVGVNLVHGTILDGATVSTASGATLTVVGPLPAPGSKAAVAIRPRSVAIHKGKPEGSPRNAWAATVSSVELDGDRARVRLTGAVPLVAEITPRAATSLSLAAGTHVWASVKAVDLDVYEV